jgi:hypothetical protein
MNVEQMVGGKLAKELKHSWPNQPCCYFMQPQIPQDLTLDLNLGHQGGMSENETTDYDAACKLKYFVRDTSVTQ